MMRVALLILATLLAGCTPVQIGLIGGIEGLEHRLHRLRRTAPPAPIYDPFLERP